MPLPRPDCRASLTLSREALLRLRSDRHSGRRIKGRRTYAKCRDVMDKKTKNKHTKPSCYMKPTNCLNRQLTEGAPNRVEQTQLSRSEVINALKKRQDAALTPIVQCAVHQIERWRTDSQAPSVQACQAVRQKCRGPGCNVWYSSILVRGVPLWYRQYRMACPLLVIITHWFLFCP